MTPVPVFGPGNWVSRWCVYFNGATWRERLLSNSEFPIYFTHQEHSRLPIGAFDQCDGAKLIGLRRKQMHRHFIVVRSGLAVQFSGSFWKC